MIVKYTDLYIQGVDYIYWGFEERKTSHGDVGFFNGRSYSQFKYRLASRTEELSSTYKTVIGVGIESSQ